MEHELLQLVIRTTNMYEEEDAEEGCQHEEAEEVEEEVEEGGTEVAAEEGDNYK